MTPNRTLHFAAQALTSLLLFALGVQLAWWGWRTAYPAWKVSLAPPPEGTARTALSSDTEAPPQASAPIRLKGVFAVDGKTPSAAVVNTGGRDQAVFKGAEIAPGVSLALVEADHIEVLRAGVRERIELDKPGIRAPAQGAKALTGGPAPTSFRLNVDAAGNNAFQLSRQELNSVLQDPRQLNFLGRIGPSPSGGVRVEDAAHGTLAGKLGLQAGDVIVAINGQPINSQGDLARLYGQFDSMGTIRAELKRNNAPVALTYHIKN
jgi:general secretion pathway protein C